MPGELVARVLSSRHPGVVYEIHRNADGEHVCNCPGFGFRRRCRHVADLVAQGAITNRKREPDAGVADE